MSKFDFCNMNKYDKRKHLSFFLKKQYKEFLATYFFILLSSSGKSIFSITNGAVFVFLWYTLSILTSCHAYISDCEHNAAHKKATHFSRRHKIKIRNLGKKCTPEIGGWTFIGAQYVWAVVLAGALAIYAIIQPTCSSQDYKDFCIGIFADTYIIVFFNIYFKGIIGDLNSISGWKKKVNYLLHTFYKYRFLNASIHVLSLMIIVCALRHYFNEFSELFNPNIAKIIGIIYIMYMINIVNISKDLIGKFKKLILPQT